MAPIGIAIIGGGIFVKQEHIPAALAIPSLVSIKAIWSRSRKTAEDALQTIPGHDASSVDLYSSDGGDGKAFDDILKRPDIVGLVMALPIVDQPAYIRKALAAGKHVLAEKPIAPDVAGAVDLIDYYKDISAQNHTILAIAENYRFQPGWYYAADVIKELGGVTGFSLRLNYLMEQSSKWFNTAWRAKPKYQGGFLLDGGVHNTAALRLLLGSEHAVESLSAHTWLTSSHLPPVDSVNATIKTKTGAIGTYMQLAGTTMNAFEFHVACKHGFVKAEKARVEVVRGTGPQATTEVKSFDFTSGVKEEVKAWAESMTSGTPNPQQTVEQALADLELLEKMLTSGDHDGARQALKFQ